MSPITGYNDRTQFIPNDLSPLGKKKTVGYKKIATILFPRNGDFSANVLAKGNRLFLLMTGCIIYLYNTLSYELKKESPV